MARGIGEFGPVREVLPEWFAVVFALLTQLGDVWFLAALLTTLYWFDRSNRDAVAAIAGVWMAGVGVYSGLKELFGLPRPEQPLLEAEALPHAIRPLYEATAFATGYGFPSGHAVNTAIVYVGLAAVLPAADGCRRRIAWAAGLVAVVSLSRVVLGVHYVVDVVAGVAVGLTLLFAALALADRLPADRPSTTFGLAGCLDAVAVLASGGYGDGDGLLVLAAALGGFAGWQLVVLRGEPGGLAPRAESWPDAGRILLAAGALLALVGTLVVVSPSAAGPVTVVVGLATAAAVAAPTVGLRSRADRLR